MAIKGLLVLRFNTLFVFFHIFSHNQFKFYEIFIKKKIKNKTYIFQTKKIPRLLFWLIKKNYHLYMPKEPPEFKKKKKKDYHIM